MIESQFETGSQTSEQLSHSSGAYFCSNCHYSISNEADYKKHYKSEFHRYNIKRRLVNLPPATFEQFLKRKNSNHFFFLFLFDIKIYKNPTKTNPIERSLKPFRLILSPEKMRSRRL